MFRANSYINILPAQPFSPLVFRLPNNIAYDNSTFSRLLNAISVISETLEKLSTGVCFLKSFICVSMTRFNNLFTLFLFSKYLYFNRLCRERGNTYCNVMGGSIYDGCLYYWQVFQQHAEHSKTVRQ
jgi:hypothetical protein